MAMKKAKEPKTFSERVLEMALSIPLGRVTTYGRLARAAGGGTMASQSITNVLSRAYDNGSKSIPFHRIVYADGHVWLNPEYEAARRELYEKEGIELDERGRITNFADVVFEFD